MIRIVNSNGQLMTMDEYAEYIAELLGAADEELKEELRKEEERKAKEEEYIEKYYND